MNQQLKPRRNPFEVPKTVEEPIVEEQVVEETHPVQNYQEEQRYYQEYEQPKPIQKPQTQKRQQRVVPSQPQYNDFDANREKYTSTMDISLRRQIKIICATRGIMFAKFVEDACREKIAREGVR